LYGARRWDTLEQALAALDADVPLALAVEAAGAGAPAAAAATPGAYGAALDLRALHQALRHGRELDAQVAARLETARHLAAHARPAEALGLLVADAPQMPLEAEHYRLLAHEAQALFDRARAELPHAQRVGLRARLDALLHLAGETVAPALAAETTLATIQKEADRTTAAIQQLASV
jgi:hypothetical protein